MVVDWIVEKLVDCGVFVLCIGNLSWVNDKMFLFIYECCFEGYLVYIEFWGICKLIWEMGNWMCKSSYLEWEVVCSCINYLRECVMELEI